MTADSADDMPVDSAGNVNRRSARFAPYDPRRTFVVYRVIKGEAANHAALNFVWVSIQDAGFTGLASWMPTRLRDGLFDGREQRNRGDGIFGELIVDLVL